MNRWIMLFALLCLCCSTLQAADEMQIDVYAGSISLLSYDGSQAGVRLTWPLKSWLRIGLDVATEITLSDDLPGNRTYTASFLRSHLLLQFSTSLGKFEPYMLGSFGRDVVGENPQGYKPPPYSPTPWFDSQWGAAWKAGVMFHLSKFRIGAELGGGTLATGFTDYNVVIGLAF